jgi:hypothetical protein
LAFQVRQEHVEQRRIVSGERLREVLGGEHDAVASAAEPERTTEVGFDNLRAPFDSASKTSQP